MNIKGIIREELKSITDSFYLLVSDDEKFIYGSGNLGGRSFEPVENFDAESILRSRYETSDLAYNMVSWAKYYTNEKKIGGELTTTGNIANNILKYNPKVVSVDFILRKRDESFPIMESDDFDWIRDITPLSYEYILDKGLEFNPPITDKHYWDMVVSSLGGVGVKVNIYFDAEDLEGGILGLFIENGNVIWTGNEDALDESYQDHINGYARRDVEVVDGRLLFPQ